MRLGRPGDKGYPGSGPGRADTINKHPKAPGEATPSKKFCPPTSGLCPFPLSCLYHTRSESDWQRHIGLSMKEFPPFRLDTVNQCLWRHRDSGDDERISVTPRAFGVLRYLVEHSGRLVTHEELLDALWPDTFVQPEVLKSHILDVRSALGDHPKNPKFIETLPKRGYQFIAPVRDASMAGEAALDVPSRKLVGRNTQLGELLNCLRATLASQRKVVFVTGEAGIGKTALVDEFLQRAAKDFPTLRVARGQCVEGYGGKEAYYPILEALGQMCGRSGGDAVVQVLSRQAPTWLVQFPALIDNKQRETLQREILGATRERMLREIGEALETIGSEKPLLLVLEDLHWVDPSTVDLISSLARRRSPGKLMLIGTYRPVDVTLAQHPLKGVKQDLLVHQLCREIALEPLAEAEVADYLAAESRGFAIPEGLAGLIYRHSEGNPLFMVAAVAHMCDRGLIALENGTWQMKVPLEKIELQAPETLRQMLELQIERLSPEEQHVLEVASVVRIPLSVTIAAAVSNFDPDTCEELFEGLAKRHQVIRPAGFRDYKTGPSLCYEFVHVLYRNVLYKRIGPARRRKLHQSVAEHSEALHVKLADVAAEGAYQFEQGGDWQRAAKYLLLAADTAGRRFEPKQATEILEHALELVNKIPEAERAQSEIEVLQKLGPIYATSYDPRAIKTYETLANRAAHYGMADAEIRALQEMAFPAASLGDMNLYMRTVNRARDLLSSRGEDDTPQRVVMRCHNLTLRMSAGKWQPGDLAEYKNLVAKLRKAGDPRLLAEAELGGCYALFNSSEYREAYRSADEGFTILLEGYDENPYLSWRFSAYGHLEVSAPLFLGAWGQVLRVIERRASMVEKNGDPIGLMFARTGVIGLQIEAMDFTGAQQTIESAIPMLASLPAARNHSLAWAGAAQAGLGNHESALDYLLKSRDEMDLHPMMPDWYFRMPLQQTLTETWLSKGDFEKARAEAEELLKVTLATDEHTFRARAFEVNARLALAEQNLDRAQDFIAKALHEMEGYEVPLAHWRVHGTAAELYRTLGNRDMAEHHRESSCATIMKLANSLPADEPLRKTFLSGPLVRKILEDPRIVISQSKRA
jgi:DNA-binding winged helix-turn-helix (wHTH) protein/tetratricopeptide (TPR) repeat protein